MKCDPSSCTNYLECLHGQFIPRECPSDLHFNAELMVCDYPATAGCKHKEEEPPASQICQDVPNGTTFPLETDRYYIVCIDGVPRERFCPAWLDFDPITGTCDWCREPTSTTVQPKKTCLDADDGTTLPHPECAMFYYCYGGRTYEDDCPPEMHWNDERKFCDSVEAAQCVEGEAPRQPDVVPQPTFPTEIPPSGEVAASRCPALNGDRPVLFPHVYCDRFWICDWGVPTEMMCPQGLHFNADRSVCDHPEEANCVVK